MILMKKFKICFYFLFLFNFSSLFAANYVVAAQKFSYARGQTVSSVSEATMEIIPQAILNNLGSALVHSVYPDEELARKKNTLNKERTALYLQLNAEYKKRDVLILENYDQKELQEKLKDAETAIQKIQTQIDENRESYEKAESEADEKQAKIAEQALKNTKKIQNTELQKYSTLFKNMFIKDEQLVSTEDVTLYKNNADSLYVPTEVALAEGYSSAVFEREAVTAGINALITGKITNYGAYIYVEVEIFSYPGGKSVGKVSEMGSTQELRFISESISRQIVPLLTGSMKIALNFEITNEEIESPQIFIDDVLQNNTSSTIIIDSGTHRIQICADGYKSASTSYYFSGNERFKIEVGLEKIGNTTFNLNLLHPVDGSVYANGLIVAQDENKTAKIDINGTSILGEFIFPDGNSSLFYIPKQSLTENQAFYINPDVLDIDQYIDTRRKWMYSAYSVLMVSLMPTFVTLGNYNSAAALYNSTKTDDALTAAKNWRTAFWISTGVSVSAGVLWVYELVRYLLAANKVIPQKAKIDTRTLEELQSAVEKSKIVSENQNENQTDDELTAQNQNIIEINENQNDENELKMQGAQPPVN